MAMSMMFAQVTLKPKQAKGLIFGLPQPALAGDLVVRGVSHSQVEMLNQLLCEVWLPSRRMYLPGAQPEKRLAICLANWVAEVQRQQAFPISERFYLREQVSNAEGDVVFEFALPYDVQQACAESIDWLVLAINEVLAGVRDLRGVRELAGKLKAKLRRLLVTGGDYYGLVDAACRLDVPLFQPHRGLLLLGTGRFQRCMWRTLSDSTSVIGVHTARNKFATARWLRLAGLPGAENFQVRSADEAEAVARQLGFPVVVKPVDQKRSCGLTAELRDPQSVRAAYAAAKQYSTRILIERWVPGVTYSLMVHNEQVLRVIRRVPGGITGDGVQTIQALFAAAQRTPQQQRLAEQYGQQVPLLSDEVLDLLRQSGWSARDVPACGVYIRMSRRDHEHAGGEIQSVDLDRVHPDNLRLALDAASLLRLDFADIDLITGDIASSWHENPSIICGINVQPHLGNIETSDIYARIVEKLMVAGCRVPVELIIVPDDANASENVLKKFLSAERGACVSHQCGLFIRGEHVGMPFAEGFSAALGLLMRADVERAVCLMSSSDIRLHGSPVHRWDSVRWADYSSFSYQEIASRSDVDSLVSGYQAAFDLNGVPMF